MALSNRAKIFSPFAALRGFDDEISSEGASKLLVKKVELSDEEKDALSDKLLQVRKGMKVVLLPFLSSRKFTLPLRLMPYCPLGNAFLPIFSSSKCTKTSLFSGFLHS
jgi:hypothetical protein